MTESVPSRRKGRWVRYAAIGVATLAVLLLVAGYLASGWFQERMRRRVVAETGADDRRARRIEVVPLEAFEAGIRGA